MVAPLVGGVTGAMTYKIFVEVFHPMPMDEKPEDSEPSECIPLDQRKTDNADECVV